MPELPEVETIRRILSGLLPGRMITGVHLTGTRMLRDQSPGKFRAGLMESRITQVARRAKFLVFRLRENGLLAHLGMSGQIFFEAADSPLPPGHGLPDRHTHLVLDLDSNARLYFRDPRMFGRFALLSGFDEWDLFKKLGPEPLGGGFTVAWLRKMLKNRKAPVKSLLLDQRIVPGMGNIYADESLHRAGIDPRTPGGILIFDEIVRLRGAVRSVLREAILQGGTSFSDFLNPRHRAGSFQLALRVYGRAGESCPDCGEVIHRSTVAQRGTHWCPRCQPGKFDG